MMRRNKWRLLAALTGILPVLGTSCTSIRDAVVSGGYDFISGTTTDLLTQLLLGTA